MFVARLETNPSDQVEAVAQNSRTDGSSLRVTNHVSQTY